jgi:hypothetical protein
MRENDLRELLSNDERTEILRSINPDFDSSYLPKKVFIIGNGAVAGGWEPVKSAIRSGSPTDPPGQTTSSELANFPLEAISTTAFLFRAFRSSLCRILRHPNVGGRSAIDLMNRLIDTRQSRFAIAQHFDQYINNGKIYFNDEIQIVEKLWAPDEDAIITTNWDKLIFKTNFPSNKVIPLHGITSHPDTLILPTEMSCDDRVFAEDSALLVSLFTEAGKGGINKVDIYNAFTRGAAANYVEAAHYAAMSWLENVEEIIIWGLGVHTYDAELSAVLRTTHAARIKSNIRPLKKLTVIDICRKKIEHIAHLVGYDHRKVTFIQANAPCTDSLCNFIKRTRLRKCIG